MNGVILIDKPTGVTSFDVVRSVRRAANERKVGHTGTLDPMASGLLVVAIGQGTKLIPYLMEGEKRYLGTVSLGAQTETDDAEGKIIETAPVPHLEESSVREALERFEGRIEQTPPAYSALKQDGTPNYVKARRGEEVRPKPRIVTIDRIVATDLHADKIEIDVRCKKGTYIRSLARDIGKSLGTRGHLSKLRRTVTSGFSVDRALPLVELSRVTFETQIIPLEKALPTLPRLQIDEANVSRVKLGQGLLGIDETSIAKLVESGSPHARLVDPKGRLLAIGLLENQRVRPIRVMVYNDPSCPDPSCPDPSCPDPSCPDPSCPDPSCPDPSCPDPS